MGTKGIKMDLQTATKLVKTAESVLKKQPAIKKIQVAGSVLRGKASDIGDVDIIVVTSTAKFPSNFQDVLKNDLNLTILSAGSRTIHALTVDQYQYDFYACDEDEFVCMLNYLTGSQTHNIRMRASAKKLGYKLNQYHLYNANGEIIKLDTEEDLYTALGKKFVEPKNR